MSADFKNSQLDIQLTFYRIQQAAWRYLPRVVLCGAILLAFVIYRDNARKERDRFEAEVGGRVQNVMGQLDAFRDAKMRAAETEGNASAILEQRLKIPSPYVTWQTRAGNRPSSSANNPSEGVDELSKGGRYATSNQEIKSIVVIRRDETGVGSYSRSGIYGMPSDSVYELRTHRTEVFIVDNASGQLTGFAIHEDSPLPQSIAVTSGMKPGYLPYSEWALLTWIDDHCEPSR